MRLAISNGCALLPQRYGLLEARWRIAAGKKLNGTSSRTEQAVNPEQPVLDVSKVYTSPPEARMEADAMHIALEQLTRMGEANEN
jgi:hypothetical protein